MKTIMLVSTLLQAVLGVSIKSYDYVVVGAGTSGLVVANRLSEDPSVSVLVIEPGTDQRNNPNVTDGNKFLDALGTPINWNYPTVPQVNAAGQVLAEPAGKAWGGTSCINGQTYIRGNSAEFDAYEDLGNKGWNWGTLLPYYKKSEQYTPPNPDQIAAGARYQSQWHGTNGHVKVGYNPKFVNGNFSTPMAQSFASRSIQHDPDLNSGSVRGWGLGPQTLDAATGRRWTSAEAYYYPVQGRRNLQIMQGTVKRITWASQKRKLSCCKGDCLVASAVEYVAADGTLSSVQAKKEVIVSAGTMRTPLVLEGSGIGNPKILKSLGIDTKIDLPGVGENFIDQTSFTLAWLGLLEGGENAFHSFYTFEDIFGGSMNAIEKSTRASLPKWAKAIAEASGNAVSASAIQKRLTIQHNLLFKTKVTAAEILNVVIPPGVNAFVSQFWPLLPFSRGSIHLGSADKINEPVIDPRFFIADFDFTASVALAKYAESFFRTKALSPYVGALVLPGPAVLPDNATDAQWEAFVRNTVTADAHPIGTASMMAKELGGVVDPELRVYGTANVRVVDASVLPMEMSGHLTATLYAVAERASDIIKKTSYN